MVSPVSRPGMLLPKLQGTQCGESAWPGARPKRQQSCVRLAIAYFPSHNFQQVPLFLLDRRLVLVGTMKCEMGFPTETGVAAAAIKWPCFNGTPPLFVAVTLSQLTNWVKSPPTSGSAHGFCRWLIASLQPWLWVRGICQSQCHYQLRGHKRQRTGSLPRPGTRHGHHHLKPRTPECAEYSPPLVAHPCCSGD